MIFGAHVILESTDADADRAFLRDVMNFKAVDAGHGWLILALPPAEVAVHPGKGSTHHLYLMCDDLPAEIARLQAAGVTTGEVSEQRWGSLSTITLPSGAKLGLYQPKHPLAFAR